LRRNIAVLDRFGAWDELIDAAVAFGVDRLIESCDLEINWRGAAAGEPESGVLVSASATCSPVAGLTGCYVPAHAYYIVKG
jgi:hypothetical protein